MERVHALLGASSADRWLACPRSVRFTERMVKRKTRYTDEGDLGHDLADMLLKFRLKRISKREYEITREHRLACDTKPGQGFHCQEMDDYVEAFVNYVLAVYETVKKKGGWATIRSEIQVDFSHVVPLGFGHLDVEILSEGRLDIIDFKYGKGVQVSARANSQLGLYAVGSIEENQFRTDIKEVYLHIYQPRLDNISVDRNSVADVLKWANGTVKRVAQLAFDGKGDFRPGSHCMFCEGKARCKALASFNLNHAKHKFAMPDEISEDDLIDIFLQTGQFKNWLNAVTDYVTDQARNGKKWKGLKLVNGKSSRKIKDERNAMTSLRKAGVPPTAYLNPASLKGITDLEKSLGIVKFNKILSSHITKPDGALTLVPLSDKRKAAKGLEAAKDDFKDL